MRRFDLGLFLTIPFGPLFLDLIACDFLFGEPVFFGQGQNLSLENLGGHALNVGGKDLPPITALSQ
jgi:hypothetical protein